MRLQSMGTPLKITELTIDGFRQFRTTRSFPLRAPSGTPLSHLVIAGPNGSGKTTVLEALILGLGRDLWLNEVDAGHPDDAFARQGGGRILVELVDPDTHDAYTCERTPPGFVVRKRFDDRASSILTGEELALFRSRLKLDYLHSGRRASRPGPVVDAVRSEFSKGQAGRMWNFKDRLKKQMGRRVPGYKGPEPLDVLWTERLNAIWKQFRDDGTYFTLTLVDPDDLNADAWDLFLYRADERVCTFDELSSGEREVLELLVTYITEPFDGLLLVDEPELHLHPQWQARMVRALRASVPRAQVFVATHADDPWDDAMSWERLLLAAPGDPRLRASA